jgi:hypothetical protein
VIRLNFLSFLRGVGFILILAAGGFAGDGNNVEGSPLAVLGCMGVGVILYFLGGIKNRQRYKISSIPRNRVRLI